MADGTGETGVDVSEMYFARGPLKEEPGFDVVMMRIPSAGDREDTIEMGEAARFKIVKFYLASATGVLRASGFGDLASEVEGAAMKILERLSDGVPETSV